MRLPERIYHLAEATNLAGIRREGLLCASRLTARSDLSAAGRERLERSQRSERVVLPDGVAIRDQRPMPAAALARCLVGMTPADWYAWINAHVFFWCDAERLERQRKACRGRPQVVLAIDTEKLLARYTAQIALTPINTGNARRQPALRGRATFVSYSDWLAHGWAAEAAGLGRALRPRSHAPVELTVRDAVPEVWRCVVDVLE